MNKQPNTTSQLKTIQLEDDFNENPAIEWISANKQYILLGFLALFALIILSYRFLANQTVKSESDFFKATTAFNHFQEKIMKPGEAQASLEDLNRLDSIMARHPELHAKYDGLLAQGLLIENDPEKANIFAQSAFQRTQKEGLNHYQSYAETSLLIGSGNYQEALAHTQQLKEKMDADSTGSYGTTLYVFNLIRLAILSQQLENWSEEKQAWEELQRVMANQEGYLVVQQLFKENYTGFNQYIEQRKKVLGL